LVLNASFGTLKTGQITASKAKNWQKLEAMENKQITPEMLEAYGFEKNDMGEGEFYYSPAIKR